ncbi:MAG: preprotein translocase subunit SecG [Chloroflexi bacterium]|jgi:protein translocase SecG subunit|nr:preprotein translocase subunit SecG [Chloroflexota bacterium]MBI51822.1 preprotein translocase subunit SecG [Chloroflexota bacterium]|tara:strand:+ start:220 stop:438 length:219 start_codon:yes stop_codon:yes gene_type:complete
MREFLSFAQIIISLLLIFLILLQVKGTGFGAGLGGIESEYRSQKIASRSLFRLTIIVIVTFISLSAISVAID